MRDWAATLDYPFSREQPGAHFTASAVVVDATGERTLLVHHRKSGSWFQPGGHFEPEDASAVAAAEREAREETGLDGDARHGRACSTSTSTGCRGTSTTTSTCASTSSRPASSPRTSAEVDAAEWLTWDDAFARIDEHALRRALLKASGGGLRE